MRNSLFKYYLKIQDGDSRWKPSTGSFSGWGLVLLHRLNVHDAGSNIENRYSTARQASVLRNDKRMTLELILLESKEYKPIKFSLAWYRAMSLPICLFDRQKGVFLQITQGIDSKSFLHLDHKSYIYLSYITFIIFIT